MLRGPAFEKVSNHKLGRHLGYEALAPQRAYVEFRRGHHTAEQRRAALGEDLVGVMAAAAMLYLDV